MNLDFLIQAVQTKLGLVADGKAGPKTWTAIYENIIGATVPAPLADAPVDARSEANIATLLPEVRPYARALIHAAAAAGIDVRVISGTRTYAEQDALFAQGRTTPGRIVTNARAGSSWHNHGVAFDIGVFDGEKYVPESPLYKAVAAIGKGLGLEWGGDWKTISDEPHYQITKGRSLAEARDLHDQGKTVFS